MLRRTAAQVGSSFGSNTTHWVPSSIDSLEEDEQPADVDVLPLGSADIVRAPQTRMPRLSRAGSRG